MLRFCHQLCASFPLMQITSMLLSLSDVSILSMSVSVAMMLLRSIESAGRGQSLACEPSGGNIPASSAPQL
jgi:hypothetical protein